MGDDRDDGSNDEVDERSDHPDVSAEVGVGTEVGTAADAGRQTGREVAARRAVLVGRDPRAVAAVLALAAAGLGWFAPELLAATSPPPPVVVATVSGSDIDYGTPSAMALTMQVAVTNLGPSAVTVRDTSDRAASAQVAPLAVIRGGTGRARIRLIPSCLGPTDEALPRLQATDGSGATADVAVVGVGRSIDQYCELLSAQQAAPDGEPTLHLAGPLTHDGSRLVLSVATFGGRRLTLTGVSTDEVALTMRSTPVSLDGTPRRVVLEPLGACPTSWLTRGPSTTLLLTVTPSPAAAAPATAAPTEGPSAPPPSHSYQVPLLGGGEVTAWVLRTACPGGPT